MKTRGKKLLSADKIAALKAEQTSPIPPWSKATNENTRRDLRIYNIDQYLAAVEKALAIENPHAKELLEIQTLANAYLIGFNDRILNTPRTGANKGRNELEALYFDLEAKVNDLSNRTGFDLLDPETWA